MFLWAGNCEPQHGLLLQQEGDGAKFEVEAEYEVHSSRRIGLVFRAAGVSAQST